MVQELQCTLVGYSTVFKRADALLASHEVFCNAFGGGVLEELICREVQQDVVGTICCMTGECMRLGKDVDQWKGRTGTHMNIQHFLRIAEFSIATLRMRDTCLPDHRHASS